jgi:hypothetical protein
LVRLAFDAVRGHDVQSKVHHVFHRIARQREDARAEGFHLNVCRLPGPLARLVVLRIWLALKHRVALLPKMLHRVEAVGG